jgi:hypothetical protein
MLVRAIAPAIALAGLIALVPLALAQEGKFAVKAATSDPPKELADDVQKLLGKNSIQLLDGGGKVIGEFWFRGEIPADATPEQIKNGITWREVKQTEVIGAVRFEQDWTDYRKQKVKAGVYTLRLGYQPADGDHQGSSEFQDFLLVVAADKDKKPELLDAKQMVELSGSSIGATHPGVFMLAPNPKAAGPAIVSAPRNHWVLQSKGEISIAGKKTGTAMGIGLNVVGHAE